jgi:sRNA-binding regulator protein Hfq
MKSNPEPTGVVRAREKDEFVSRKLIRPALPQLEHRPEGQRSVSNGERAVRPEKAGAAGRKSGPAEQTHAEMFYFQKQIQGKTPMTLVLKNGETIVGVIEWYDKNCLKINRNGRSSVLIYKAAIRYIYKSSEEVHK